MSSLSTPDLLHGSDAALQRGTSMEFRLLQAVVLVGACVPLAAGLWGVLGGLGGSSAVAVSEGVYLSGLLLGIGLCYWACIPSLAARGVEVRLLTAIVVIGGLARLYGATRTGFGPGVTLPLIMELGVTPTLALWRERVAAQARLS